MYCYISVALLQSFLANLGIIPKLCHQPMGRGLVLEGSFRYPLAREGVYATGGSAFLAHTKQKVNNIVDLTVLRLAFFMGYK